MKTSSSNSILPEIKNVLNNSDSNLSFVFSGKLRVRSTHNWKPKIVYLPKPYSFIYKPRDLGIKRLLNVGPEDAGTNKNPYAIIIWKKNYFPNFFEANSTLRKALRSCAAPDLRFSEVTNKPGLFGIYFPSLHMILICESSNMKRRARECLSKRCKSVPQEFKDAVAKYGKETCQIYRISEGPNFVAKASSFKAEVIRDYLGHISFNKEHYFLQKTQNSPL